jgi:hypothetical protein
VSAGCRGKHNTSWKWRGAFHSGTWEVMLVAPLLTFHLYIPARPAMAPSELCSRSFGASYRQIVPNIIRVLSFRHSTIGTSLS